MNERQGESSVGIMAAVIVGILVIGGMAVVAVVGAVFYMRLTMVQEMENLMRDEAVQEMQAIQQLRAAETQAQLAESNSLVIELDQSGVISIEGEAIELESLASRIENAPADSKSIVIKAHEDCPYLRVVEVQRAAIEGGADSIAVVGSEETLIRGSDAADSKVDSVPTESP